MFLNYQYDPMRDEVCYWNCETDDSLILLHYDKANDENILMLVEVNSFSKFLGSYPESLGIVHSQTKSN